MTFEEYQKLAVRTIVGYDKKEGLFLTAQLNLIGEAGEIIEQYNRISRGQDDALDREHFIEELGDVLWGCAFVCDVMKISLDKTMRRHMQNHTPERMGADFDMRRFSEIISDDPGYDQSGHGFYGDNTFIHSCAAIGCLKNYLKIPKQVERFGGPKEMTRDFQHLSTMTLETAVGDIVENLTLMADKELGMTLDEIAEFNIKKLEKRYDPTKEVAEIVSNPQLYNLMSHSYTLCQEGGTLLNFAYESLDKNHWEQSGDSIKEILKARLAATQTGIRVVALQSDIEWNTIKDIVKYGQEDLPPPTAPEDCDPCSGIVNIRGIIENSCKMADLAKKAHYKGREVDKEKMQYYAKGCADEIENTITNFGLNRDLALNEDLWYVP